MSQASNLASSQASTQARSEFWRRVYDKYAPACLAPIFKPGRSSIMTWGAFIASSKSPLILTPKTMRITAHFVDLIYKGCLEAFYYMHDDETVVLMEDGRLLFRRISVATVRVLEVMSQVTEWRRRHVEIYTDLYYNERTCGCGFGVRVIDTSSEFGQFLLANINPTLNPPLARLFDQLLLWRNEDTLLGRSFMISGTLFNDGRDDVQTRILFIHTMNETVPRRDLYTLPHVNARNAHEFRWEMDRRNQRQYAEQHEGQDQGPP
ncbi:MAG: hypothetical protein J3Q66DRAFT_403055 [Benniella sp.]|nr:MAG: hypothetical protein J3Q66DRAFT_403055 [Benniella sp.]